MKNDEEKVIDSVKGFIEGGDTRDAQLLNNTLHESFLNVQNGFFDEKGIYSIDKKRYLQLIADGTFGGVPRIMDIQLVDVQGGIAMVKAELSSSQLKFTSFISLVLDEEENWKVIANFPHVVPN